jgi:LuxR family transcriptional regulator, maltose regulon positive regulatory protein
MANTAPTTRERVAKPATVIVTKLAPPPLRAQTIQRDRLIGQLEARPGTRLTLVVAPAGCGKSTLLGSWRQGLAKSKPVAWVNLDEGDNDPVVMWSHVLVSLQRACPNLAHVPTPETVGPAEILEGLLPHLVNELATQDTVSLVLDDFHRLSSGPSREAVAWLIEHAPASLKIIIASRTEPALAVARLRAHGDLVEVRAKDLAFTTEETQKLMNDRLQLDLAQSEIRGLTERTEGWAAGLYLAALSLQKSEDRRDLLQRFDGSSRAVVDFLASEVLATHEQATLDLMLRASVLDQFSGALLDALLDAEGSAEVLAEISLVNLFLLPLDERGTYRFHHLFSRLLRAELEYQEPGLATVLHRRASAWYFEQGLIEPAIEHAIQGEDFAVAGRVISEAGMRWTSVARYATVLSWFQRLPRQYVNRDARLLVLEAWVQTICGNRVAAASAMETIERQGFLQVGPVEPGFATVEASLVTLKASRHGGNVASGFEHALRATELVDPDSPMRYVVSWSLGEAHFLQGELNEADRCYADAVPVAIAGSGWIIAASALALRSLIAGEEGRHNAQAKLAHQAWSLAKEHRVDEISGEVSVALGMSLLSEDNVSEALPVLEHGVAVTRRWAEPTEHASALVYLARALRAAGDNRAATGAIAEARQVAESCADPGNLVERIEAVERSRSRSLPGNPNLTPRELAVLRLLRSTLSERDIGREFHVSHNTIHSHTRSIYRKLGVSTRAEAVKRAREGQLF